MKREGRDRVKGEREGEREKEIHTSISRKFSGAP